MIARLKPGVSAEAAAHEASAVQYRIHLANASKHVAEDVWSRPMIDDLVKGVRTQKLVLLCAVTCMLLIACLNVSNLLVARAAARRKEVAIRGSLGGGPACLDSRADGIGGTKLVPHRSGYADVARASPAALSAEAPNECSGAGLSPAPQRKSPHDHFHIHVVMSAATFYGTLRQILSWRLWCGQSEVLGSFLKSKIPSLVAKLLHDKAVDIIVA